MENVEPCKQSFKRVYVGVVNCNRCDKDTSRPTGVSIIKSGLTSNGNY